MNRTRAFTLVEILVVCALLAIVMGMGAAFLGNMNKVMTVKAERGRIDALLRQAHNSASMEQARAWVILDPETNRVEVRSMSVVGLWHFEDEELTGFPPGQDISLGNGRLSNPQAGEKGKIGRCVVLEGGRRGIDIGTNHLFDSRTGIALEAWIFPFQESNCVLFKKGRGLKLSLSGRYLEGTLLGVGTVDNSWSARGGKGDTRKLTVPVLPGRWSRVSFSFDGRKMELRVNGALAGVWPPPKKKKRGRKQEEEEERYVYKADEGAPLVVAEGFRGMVDELRVSASIYTDVFELDPNVAIDGERSNALTIHFAPGGWLDEEFHQETARIVLIMRNEPEKAELIEVSRLGTVR